MKLDGMKRLAVVDADPDAEDKLTDYIKANADAAVVMNRPDEDGDCVIEAMTGWTLVSTEYVGNARVRIIEEER